MVIARDEKTQRFVGGAWTNNPPVEAAPSLPDVRGFFPRTRFTSYYHPKITKGPTFSFSRLPWPYTEGLRIKEMANELAFFAIGIYGHELPKQHGAPTREVIRGSTGSRAPNQSSRSNFLTISPPRFGIYLHQTSMVLRPMSIRRYLTLGGLRLQNV